MHTSIQNGHHMPEDFVAYIAAEANTENYPNMDTKPEMLIMLRWFFNFGFNVVNLVLQRTIKF